ncbi:MAG: branched-chain amino acid aminotransferase [Sphingobacteriales bacterium]|nr:branched-chain amino acid aminotransferase [Sphingobacteriales bacterium]
METMTGIKTTLTRNSKLKEVDFNHLEFGKYTSDHMLVADFYHGQWNEPQIVPFANLSMSPTALCLHYGQTVFEGMKAFRMIDGRVNIFRIDKHYERFNRSLRRMCMAEIPYEIFEEGMKELMTLDKNWVPNQEESALYVRPFMYASEARFGVKPSDEYRFIIFTGPVGQLFSKPVRMKVEREYIRAAKGGTGSTKCGGNYGGAMYPTKLAKEQGYDNVIWTDAGEHNFIEESGAMNLLFVIDGKLLSPPSSDSILHGVTKDSLLTIARDTGVDVEERPISLNEVKTAFKKGTIAEAYCVGTAAVASPIEVIGIDGEDYHLPVKEKGIVAGLKEKLENIRNGTAEDIYNWNTIVG